MPLRFILLAIATAAMFGFSFVAIHAGLQELPPILFTGYRFVLAAFPLIFFYARPKINIWWLIGYALFQDCILFGFIFLAIDMGMPAGLTSLVAQVQVFFTAFFAAVLLQEKPTTRQIVAASVSTIGIILIAYSQAQTAPLLPFLLVLAGAASWGIANIFVKVAKPENPIGFVVWSAIFVPIPLFAISSVFEGTSFGLPAAMPSFVTLGAIAFTAYLATVFAYGNWVNLLGRFPAADVLPFALLIPIFGLGSMALVYGERIATLGLLGAGIVIAGLAINVFSRSTPIESNLASD